MVPVAKPRRLRIQSVNHMFPLTFTVHLRLKNLDALEDLPDYQTIVDEKHKAHPAAQTVQSGNRNTAICYHAKGQRAIQALLGLLYFRVAHRHEGFEHSAAWVIAQNPALLANPALLKFG
jgi:hypothetical protein